MTGAGKDGRLLPLARDKERVRSREKLADMLVITNHAALDFKYLFGGPWYIISILMKGLCLLFTTLYLDTYYIKILCCYTARIYLDFPLE